MNYTECEKLKAVDSERRTIHDFIEWLGENGHGICDRVASRYAVHPGVELTRKRHEVIVFEYLGIDEDTLETERRAMLDVQREANKT